jgi:hypothetical protein
VLYMSGSKSIYCVSTDSLHNMLIAGDSVGTRTEVSGQGKDDREKESQVTLYRCRERMS